MSRTQTVSYSELDTYRQCPLKHQLSYKEKWRDPVEAEALGRGTLFHSVMEEHYKHVHSDGGGVVGLTRARTAVMALLVDPNTGEFNDERAELVAWIYDGYVDRYGSDPDWKVVAIEKSFEAWLPTARGGRSNFKLAGTVDLIVKDMSAGGGLWIVDHKTCRNLPNQKDFDMEDQTALYAYLLQRSGVDVRGAIYNHCRTYKLKTREMQPEERFKRTLTVRTPAELRTMALEALDAFREAYRKRDTDARRHPDGERCGWKCSYTEACLASRKKPDARMKIFEDFGFVQSDTKPGPTFQRLAKEAEAAKA